MAKRDGSSGNALPRFLLSIVGVAAAFACARTAVADACRENVLVARPDAVSIAADCYGAANQPTLILVHGWSFSRRVWDRQVQSLSSRFRVIRFDLRGHGDSSQPRTVGAYAPRWSYADDLVAVMDHFKVPSATLVGWSFGSIVTADAALRLGRERTDGLILVSGSLESGTAKGRAYFQGLMSRTRALSDTNASAADVESAIQGFVRESRAEGRWSRDEREALASVMRRLDPDLRALVVKREPYSLTRDIGNLALPVLFIHGQRDPALSALASLEASRQIPTSYTSLYESAGHWPFREAQERFDREVGIFTLAAQR
jgi:non-heme chloroperoxidase